MYNKKFRPGGYGHLRKNTMKPIYETAYCLFDPDGKPLKRWLCDTKQQVRDKLDSKGWLNKPITADCSIRKVEITIKECQ